MKPSKIPHVAFLIFFHFLFLNYFHFPSSHCANLGSETDKFALLAFKSKVVDDPFGALSAWNDSVDFCQWHGVTCSLRHRRVVALDLRAQNLTGTISPFIGNLTFLRLINLQQNKFYGKIPPETGRLFRLRSIRFSLNMLQGEIPANITHCSELRILDLVVNKLEGNIPSELGNLFKLVGLGLTGNNYTGSIPQSLSNLSFLQQISLSENRLSGNIPSELGLLKQLNMFQVSANSLTGSIPIQLFNISSMDYFAVTENKLVGEIPHYVGFTLPNIRVLLLGSNRFTGEIPPSISNASKLEKLDFFYNLMAGSIPEDLGKLKNLIRLNFARNNLGTGKGNDLRFLDSLVNCTFLEVVSLSSNSLSGVLPNSIANFSSHLIYLYMSANRISGTIPTGIGNLKNLILIAMEENLLTGSIPTSVGYLLKLQVLSLYGNKISGEIPSSLGNLIFLTEVDLQGNSIRGGIPSALGNCLQLQKLDLSDNNLSGTIPREVIGLSSFVLLDLSRNHLSGPIPLEVGRLKGIQQLDLSENKLSGEIPTSLASCVGLEYLNFSDNSFQGPIHSGFSSLKGLQDLDLSRNKFSGKIPMFLNTFRFLRKLNLSFNKLEGEVPSEGVFKNARSVSIIGNNKLCGGIPELHLHSCRSRGSRKLWQHSTFKIVISAVLLPCLLSTCFIVFVFYQGRKRRRRRRSKALVNSSIEDKYLKISYAELLKATEGFSSANLIGIGGYGYVYKGILGTEETNVAVKVLDLQQRGASKSFIAECEALRSIRHRNLVKIITSCSSIDTRGNEFKALVYEFMPNGSLENWLNQKEDEQNQRPKLNLMQRLSIAIDVANVLEYLHHHCHTSIVHCDLKPSNVLLDNEMVAHVGDFGLSRLLHDNSPDQTSTSRVRGSIGYVAPEYGALGEVSTHGDVYSFGILLLEMFTGKRPTDDMFEEGLSLHKYTKMGLPDQVAEIIDPTILEEVLEIQADIVRELQPNLRAKFHEIQVSILRVGILCSEELPRDRMKIKDAIMELQEAQKMIQAIKL